MLPNYSKSPCPVINGLVTSNSLHLLLSTLKCHVSNKTHHHVSLVAYIRHCLNKKFSKILKGQTHGSFCSISEKRLRIS